MKRKLVSLGAIVPNYFHRFVSKLFKYFHLWRWEIHELNASTYMDAEMFGHVADEKRAADFHWKAAEFFAKEHLQKLHPRNPFYRGIFKC